jgi:hypothetical protein
MATIKKACKGALYPKSSSVSKRLKAGGSFPDLNKDGKITKADILKGRGVIAKKGMKVEKAEDGKMQKLPKRKSGKLSPQMQLEMEKFKYQRDMDRMKLDREMGKEKESRPSSAPIRIAKKGKMVKKSAPKKMMKQASPMGAPMMKKGGAAKKTMKKGGKMSKTCAYGC